MASQLIYILQIITLLDSICFGITYPFLSSHIQSLGADHVITGILGVGCLICKLVSADFLPLLKTCGKRLSMVIVLLAALGANLLLTFSSNYWYIIFSRYIFVAAANLNYNLCKELVSKNALQHEKEYLLSTLDILNGCGYIIGPTIAGYLRDVGFLYIGLLADSLTVVNICLALNISKTCNIRRAFSEKSVVNIAQQSVDNIITNCKKSDFKRNWDIMAIKFLCASSTTIFYGKFTQILRHNFRPPSSIIGHTYSYMNFLGFVSTFITSRLKDRFTVYSPIILGEKVLTFLSACMLIASYFPSYNLYMIMCIPIIFISTFIDFFTEDLSAGRRNSHLNELYRYIKFAAGMTMPIVFGFVCNYIGYHAVILFSVIPVVLSVQIINRYTKQRITPDEIDRKDQ